MSRFYVVEGTPNGDIEARACVYRDESISFRKFLTEYVRTPLGRKLESIGVRKLGPVDLAIVRWTKVGYKGKFALIIGPLTGFRLQKRKPKWLDKLIKEVKERRS